MKKLGLLIMPLMAVSLLASCGGGGGESSGVKFSVVDYNVTLDKTNTKAVVNLDWEPSSDVLSFKDFTFTGTDLTSNEVEQTGEKEVDH